MPEVYFFPFTRKIAAKAAPPARSAEKETSEIISDSAECYVGL